MGHEVLDASDRPRRHGAQLDVLRGRFRLQQPAQRRDRGTRTVQLGLQPLQVVGDQRSPGARVGGAEDALDVGQGTSSSRSRWMTWAVGIWSAA